MVKIIVEIIPVVPNIFSEFYKKGQLDVHILTVHEGKKLNSCNICGSNFRTKKALNEHFEAVHDGRKEEIEKH